MFFFLVFDESQNCTFCTEDVAVLILSWLSTSTIPALFSPTTTPSPSFSSSSSPSCSSSFPSSSSESLSLDEEVQSLPTKRQRTLSGNKRENLRRATSSPALQTPSSSSSTATSLKEGRRKNQEQKKKNDNAAPASPSFSGENEKRTYPMTLYSHLIADRIDNSRKMNVPWLILRMVTQLSKYCPDFKVHMIKNAGYRQITNCLSDLLR
jgi:hypothetical protein